MNTVFDKNPKILEKRVGSHVKADAPRVSVVIPAYNVAKYIAEALDSALAQNFRDFEVIVVNDGSPDTARLEKVLENYFDKIIYIKQENGGAAAARNTAIAAARGALLAFLDGDDVWYPEKLDAQTAFLDAGNYQMIYCDALLFGEPLYEGKRFTQSAPSKGKVTTESLLDGRCNVLTSGSLVDRESVVKYGLFDVTADRVEDFELWFRLSKNNVEIGYQEKVMVKYRVRHGSLTGNNIEKAERGIRALEMVKDKNDLTESELRAWQNQMTSLKAELSLERGKYNLVNKSFAEARRNFAEANVYRHNFKLQALMWMLAISPNLVLKLFKIMRSAEFSYINPDNFPK